MRAGIGLGIALAFLEQGEHVVLVSRSLTKLQAAVPKQYISAAASQTSQSSVGKAFLLPKDLTTVRHTLADHRSKELPVPGGQARRSTCSCTLQVSGCQECISEGVELLGGRLHILVNNAGHDVKLVLTQQSARAKDVAVGSIQFMYICFCCLQGPGHIALLFRI